jgi:hypothetical protein
MRLLQYLQEEYYARWRDTEILVNPDTKEMLKTFGKAHAVRWLSNWKKKLIYVWYAGFTHTEVMTHVSKEMTMNCLVRGRSVIMFNGKLYTAGLDDITTKPGIMKPQYKGVLDYLQPYFDENIVEKIYASYKSDVEMYGESWLRQWWEGL